jgi:hypothetical protein
LVERNSVISSGKYEAVSTVGCVDACGSIGLDLGEEVQLVVRMSASREFG